MTNNGSQLTNKSGQNKPASLHEYIDRLAAELKQCRAECDKLRADIAALLGELTEERQQRVEATALLLATAQALGLDSGDVSELPQMVMRTVEHLDRKQELVDELRRQVDMWQARILEAGSE